MWRRVMFWACKRFCDRRSERHAARSRRSLERALIWRTRAEEFFRKARGER